MKFLLRTGNWKYFRDHFAKLKQFRDKFAKCKKVGTNMQKLENSRDIQICKIYKDQFVNLIIRRRFVD